MSAEGGVKVGRSFQKEVKGAQAGGVMDTCSSRGKRTEYQPKKGNCGFGMFLFSAQQRYFSAQTPREVSVNSYRKWQVQRSGNGKFGAGKVWNLGEN